MGQKEVQTLVNCEIRDYEFFVSDFDLVIKRNELGFKNLCILYINQAENAINEIENF